MATTFGKAFYERHVDFLEKQDINNLIEMQYHPDAVLVGFDFIVRGQAALREHFKNYLEHLGTITLLSTDKFTEIEDAIFFEATVKTDFGEAVVYDVFTFQDGKAIRQFTGVKSVKPKQS
ncbi:MAG: nuclear transport factor 2 family protein [Chloroflexi bacterium]|nr:nuclear transport factor 2 family protein [Chloroflexota bacterium]